MLMALGIPEEVAVGHRQRRRHVQGQRDADSSMFYPLKSTTTPSAEWKDHYLAYTKGRQGLQGPH